MELAPPGRRDRVAKSRERTVINDEQGAGLAYAAAAVFLRQGPFAPTAWMWDVAPKDKALPLVGAGMSDDPGKAMRAMECTMEQSPGTSAYGIMIRTPGLSSYRCTRGAHGYTWRREA